MNSVRGVISSRRQVSVLIMEPECEIWSENYTKAANSLVSHHISLGQSLEQQIKDMSIDEDELNASIVIGVQLSVTGMLDTMEETALALSQEPHHPGTIQAMLKEHPIVYPWMLSTTRSSTVERDIIVSGEKLVFPR